MKIQTFFCIFFFSINSFSQSNQKFEIRNSDYNELNLPQVIERIGSAFDSISGYRRELKYDKIGNIVEEKVFSKLDNQIDIETIEYKYDTHNNVTEINRSNPKYSYPIMVAGGLPIYAKVEFKYKYDIHGYWIKKTHIVNGKRIIIEKRKFI